MVYSSAPTNPIGLLIGISLSERARLVDPWHLRAPTLDTASFYYKYLPGRAFLFSLFSSFVLCACVYPEHGTAGEPGAVAGVSGYWRVEGGGCKERGHRFRG